MMGGLEQVGHAVWLIAIVARYYQATVLHLFHIITNMDNYGGKNMDYGNILQKIGVREDRAMIFAPILSAQLPAFGIHTPARVAALLVQCHIESPGFARLSENLSYGSAARLCAVWPSRFPGPAAAGPYVRAPERLANCVYAKRLGNGPAESGDGWRFRGRGLIQLTGRSNYQAAGRALGRPLVDQPELVALAPDAVRTACWFWNSRGCNALADAGDINAITRRVHGPAMLKAAERRRTTERLMVALTQAWGV